MIRNGSISLVWKIQSGDGVKAYLWTRKTWQHNDAIIVPPALLFLPVLHSSTARVPPWKWHSPSTSKAANTRAVSRGDCWNVGHCVGCVKSVTLGWALETERVFFPLLNPTSLGEEPASDIIRWIFKRTKVPLRFFTVPVWKKLNKNPIQHRYPVWVCVCVCKQHI